MDEITTAAAEMGANAVVGIDLRLQTVGTNAQHVLVAHDQPVPRSSCRRGGST
jgi:uncharacterized protein YbjQ (UPF0145 family)